MSLNFPDASVTPLVNTAARVVPCGLAAAAAIVAALVGSGCDGGERANANVAAQTHASAAAPQSAAIVELSASQLNAIRIEPVGTYPFSVEKEAVGNIDFDEDLAVTQAESALVGAAATFELTGKELRRVQDLFATNSSFPQKELEQAVSDHETAEGALKAARDAVRVLGKTDTQIDRLIATGKIEAAHSSIKWMAANVTESDTPFVRVGQPVTVKVTAHPGRVFRGKVARIYAVVDPNIHRSKIRCEISDPTNDLRPGMLATFLIRVQDPADAIAIPADAVVREGDGTMTAWVTTDRRHFQQTAIKPGLRQDDHVQILEGLRRGELVVSEGGVFLSNMLDAPPSD
jgi:cobalt-zinc-cadmium efflux system membrane fusion protein